MRILKLIKEQLPSWMILAPAHPNIHDSVFVDFKGKMVGTCDHNIAMAQSIENINYVNLLNMIYMEIDLYQIEFLKLKHKI